jgi:sterol desaturase/sphingolipid hydroxylase (fatty acid hydroxylase superfamily)
MEPNPEKRSIEIGQDTLKYLNTTRKWTMFLAIIGFIFLGLVIFFVLIAGTFLSVFKSADMGSGIIQTWIFFPVIITLLLYFFPVLYLFRFSKHTAKAVQTLSQEELHKAFRNLKSYFVYIGILLIIILGFYLLALIITGTSLAFLKGMG